MRVRIVALVAGLLAFATLLPSAQAAPRPNVLIVNLDDQSYNTLMAEPHVKQWMVDGGTTFTHAYTGSPLCCPSRATLMSGRYPHNNGVRTFNYHPFQQRDTMQHEFLAAGYRTGIVGKFFVEWINSHRPPFFSNWTLGWGYRNATYYVQGHRRVVPYGPSFVFQQAISYLRRWHKRDASRPWYLYVTPRSPHSPFTAAAPFTHKNYPYRGTPATHERDRSDKPPWVRRFHVTQQQGARVRSKQLDTLGTVDVGFNQLMRTLAKLGELNNTYVIYTSDSGFFWGEHGLTEKHFPYDGAIHIPFLFRGPGVAAGAVDDRLTVNADVAPTMYQLTGVTPSYVPDGKPFVGPPAHTQILVEYTRAARPPFPPNWASLITLNSWYSEYYGKHGRVVFREYYNLASDPYQLKNLLHYGGQAPPGIHDVLSAARRCAGVSCP